MGIRLHFYISARTTSKCNLFCACFNLFFTSVFFIHLVEIFHVSTDSHEVITKLALLLLFHPFQHRNLLSLPTSFTFIHRSDTFLSKQEYPGLFCIPLIMFPGVNQVRLGVHTATSQGVLDQPNL